MSKTTWLLTALFGVGVLLTWLHFAEPLLPGQPSTPLHTLQSIVHGLGEAFVIAAVLGFVVDKAAKASLMEEFARDVSGHIIGQYLPAVMRDPIVRMLANRLVRNDWRIRYDISEIQGHPDYLKLKTTSSFNVNNLSKDDEEIPINYDVEKSLFPDVGESEIEYIHCREEHGSGRLDYDKNMTNDPRLNSQGDDLVFADTLLVRAGNSFRVEFCSTEVVRIGSILPFFAKQLVMPPCVLDVKHAIQGMRTIVYASFCTAGDGEPVTEEPGLSRWSFKKPMLYGQGFTVRFSRTVDKETPGA